MSILSIQTFAPFALRSWRGGWRSQGLRGCSWRRQWMGRLARPAPAH